MESRHAPVSAALDALPMQVAVLDAGGVIQYTNRAWRAFGRANGLAGDPGMVGETYLAVCDRSDDEDATAVAAAIRRVLARDVDEVAHEYPCHSPDEHRWFLMRAVPIDALDTPHVLVVHLDITERKLSELAVADRNEQLDALAGILAHDLRNPLGVALGRARLLREELGEADGFEPLVKALERMDGLVDDALTLARKTDVEETGPVALADVAAGAWASVETGAVGLSVEGTVTLDADRSLLAQLLENLFRNAVQHGGRTVTVGPLGDGGGFYVADDGPGIPPADREAVFRPEYTTHDEGTGLGMAIVERIADAHGWTVDVAESESGGARFEVIATGRDD